MDALTKCPRCGEMAVQSKTVLFRELNARMKPVGTEIVLERECQRCGWMASEPAPVTTERPPS